MLTSCKQEKEIRTSGLQKDCKHIHKQSLPWSNPHVCLCSDGAVWSSGLTNWESSAWVLSFASDSLFCTEWPWTRWSWTGFLDLRDRQISQVRGSMFISGKVAEGWRTLFQLKQGYHRWTINARCFIFTCTFGGKLQSFLPLTVWLFVLLRSLLI